MHPRLPKLVALTGATGFLGRHIAQQLRSRGCRVRALVRPSSDVRYLQDIGVTCCAASLDEVDTIVPIFKDCETVFHVAGAVSLAGAWEAFVRVNVEGTRNVLQAARQANVRRVVHTSSIVAVGASPTPSPIDESACWNLGPQSVPYVTTKRWAEELALAANDARLEVVVVNPSSVVGPDDFGGSEFGRLCKRFWRGHIRFHFGGGNNYVDVRDVARGHLLAAAKGRPGERYLLTGANRTHQAFFLDLCRAARRSIPRLRLPNMLAPWIGMLQDRWKKDSHKKPYLSCGQADLMGWFFYFTSSKARAELGYEPRLLQQTLADTHQFWMCSPKPIYALPAHKRAG